MILRGSTSLTIVLYVYNNPTYHIARHPFDLSITWWTGFMLAAQLTGRWMQHHKWSPRISLLGPNKDCTTSTVFCTTSVGLCHWPDLSSSRTISDQIIKSSIITFFGLMPDNRHIFSLLHFFLTLHFLTCRILEAEDQLCYFWPNTAQAVRRILCVIGFRHDGTHVRLRIRYNHFSWLDCAVILLGPWTTAETCTWHAMDPLGVSEKV